jgi:hypothetical protein
VRTDYVPNVARAPAHAAAITHFVDARTGRALPVDAATSTLRVELADPKARDDRAKHAARVATTLYAAGDVVADNLKRLAEKRTDIFGEGGAGGGGAAAPAAPIGPAAPGAPAALPEGFFAPDGGAAAKRARLA